MFTVIREPISPIPIAVIADRSKVALGAMLFVDTRLSKDDNRSCQSCHDVSTNGASARRFDQAIDGTPIHRNTLTVFNATLSFGLDWKGDIPTLEQQAESTIENPQTMGLGIRAAVRRMVADPSITQAFRNAYGHGPDRQSLLDAIATYERSLVTPDSAFDRWLLGDANALTAKELHGYALFKSLGCVSCHQGVNVGGNLFERSGVFEKLTGASGGGVFRVPSLRNVAVTAPYFHDGSAPTLIDAVQRMAISQLDQSLTDDQADLLVAFLHTLTGRYLGSPVSAPPP